MLEYIGRKRKKATQVKEKIQHVEINQRVLAKEGKKEAKKMSR